MSRETNFVTVSPTQNMTVLVRTDERAMAATR